jgi:hypothetical protein
MGSRQEALSVCYTFFVPEDLPTPIGESVDEVILRLAPETATAYGELKRELKEVSRDIRRRHRGAVREKLLRQKADEFQAKVRELLVRVAGSRE